MATAPALPNRLAALQSAGMVSHILHGNSAETADAALLEKLCKHVQGPVFRLAEQTYAFLIAPVPGGAAAAQVLQAMQQEFGDMDVTFAAVPTSRPATQASPGKTANTAPAEGTTTRILEEVSALRADQARLAETLRPMQVILERLEARLTGPENPDRIDAAPATRPRKAVDPRPVAPTTDNTAPAEDELRGILDTFLTRMNDGGSEHIKAKTRA